MVLYPQETEGSSSESFSENCDGVTAIMKVTYDGDQLSGCIALSHQQIRNFEMFRPHYAIHSFTDYQELNGNCRLPDVDIGIIANAFEREEDELGIAELLAD